MLRNESLIARNRLSYSRSNDANQAQHATLALTGQVSDAANGSGRSKAKRPNVLLIVVDDMGFPETLSKSEAVYQLQVHRNNRIVSK